MFLKGQSQPAEHGLAEGVILVDHANPADPQNVPKILYLLTGLIVIRSTHIEHVVLQRRVKHFRAGEKPDNGHLVSFSQGDIFGRSRRADEKSSGKNSFLLK